MKVSKIPGLGRFGIFIDDVDLQNISDDQWMEIGHLHMKNLVTIIRNTNLTKDRQVELCNKFGERRHGIKNYLLEKYRLSWEVLLAAVLDNSSDIDKQDKTAVLSIMSVQEKTESGADITRVSGGYTSDGLPNGLFAEGELLWHSNESGTLTFSPGVALFAEKNVVGSATSFITNVDYYESVPDSFRRELDEMILIHRFTPGKVNPGLNADQDTIIHLNMCPFDGKEIPMVITSPGGIRGLHYSKNNGDFLLFDNSITLHRRLGNIKDRLCYRIQHDYTNLQDDVWYPYSQSNIAKQYRREIRNFVKTSGIKNFKLPPKQLIDYIPFLNR